MVCLGLEPGVAGWKAQTNPLSYSGTPYHPNLKVLKIEFYDRGMILTPARLTVFTIIDKNNYTLSARGAFVSCGCGISLQRNSGRRLYRSCIQGRHI